MGAIGCIVLLMYAQSGRETVHLQTADVALSGLVTGTNCNCRLQITADHWPFSKQMSKAVTQNLGGEIWTS